jgi:phosphoglucomutase
MEWQKLKSVEESYRLWSTHPYFDEATRANLRSIADNLPEIEDCFYRDLEFGTGGLRGIIAPGTNRINRYTIRQATQGLAAYIAAQGATARNRGVAIAYDSRHYSKEFGREAALVLNANGIVTYLWESLRPTPMLSFAVRQLGCIAGIVITASHNPPEYNGFKVYWEDGAQIPPDRANEIQSYIAMIQDLTSVHPMAEEVARANGLFRSMPPTIDREYLAHLLTLHTVSNADAQKCYVLYTPLHGSGSIPVRRVLIEAGYQIHVVSEQEPPDPSFSTVRSPNPEEPDAFVVALRHAHAVQPDIIMATDPDADRLGVMTRDSQGQYRLLTGNQLGAILVDYLLSTRAESNALPANGVVLKTIATSNLVAPLCERYGVTLVETHTGFKFIGDKIREYEETGNHTFLFGFEESYGYLAAPFVRDKDAVMAALLVAAAAAYHKQRGRNLYDALVRIWDQCGYFCEDLYQVLLPGREGADQITQVLNRLRVRPPVDLFLPIAFTEDYLTGLGMDWQSGSPYSLKLGRANAIRYGFADGGFVVLRPSGTEPKLKVYISVRGTDEEDAQQRLGRVRAAVTERVQV